MRGEVFGKGVLVRGVWPAALAVAGLLAFGPSAASAAVPGCGEGGIYFPTITGPSAPEEYPCEVTLGEEQELREVDNQHVAVYSDGMPAFILTAEAAHDAEGAAVPTSLEKTGRAEVTITVHYLAGNPAAGGAPFAYPITGGTGWEGGFRTEEADIGFSTPPVAPPTTEVHPAPIVLGGKAFAPNGTGWGTERPAEIFNGGDPSGLITKVSWRSWGGAVAIGWGRNPIFKPHGGYYRHPVAIELRANDIGTCEGRRAYLRLMVREPSRPGGPLGPWRSWSGSSNICEAPARR
jgi:hypothetical protein